MAEERASPLPERNGQVAKGGAGRQQREAQEGGGGGEEGEQDEGCGDEQHAEQWQPFP